MPGNQHVRQLLQFGQQRIGQFRLRMVFEKQTGLEFIDIQSKAAEVAATQCCQRSCGVQHLAAAGVDQQYAGLAGREEIGAEQMLGACGQRAMQGDGIGLRGQFGE